MLIDFLKNNQFFQNVASWLYAAIPSVIEHNFEKYKAIKKAFYLTGLERLEGDYLEFGVFTGSSLVLATRVHKRFGFLGKTRIKFYGFDSFSGFGAVSDYDRHPFYTDTIFKVDARKIIRNIQKKTKGVEVEIIHGYFEHTLHNRNSVILGIKKARVIFIDCDLKDPAALALEFIRPVLQPGTILLMDDFFSYKGSITHGVAGAYYDFCNKYREISWRMVYYWGYGGVAFIVSSIK